MFDPLLDPRAWFDVSLIPEAWFDTDLIPTPDFVPLVSAFLAVTPSPDYAHPVHDHNDLVAIGTEAFLALGLLVVVVAKRLGLTKA
jgi:hypothetical protein